MLKFTALLFLLVTLAGCGKSGDEPAQSQVPTFTGKPRDFNGSWSGIGSANTDHWQTNGLTYTLHINKTPEGADVYFHILEADGSNFSMGRVVDHYVVGNTLYSVDNKKAVGTIGTDGFTLSREDTGQFIVQFEPNGNLSLKGHLQYGQTQVRISATLH